MLCSSCSTENPDGAKFCVECGAAFPVRCRHCGHVAATVAKFCAECGERLEGRAAEALARPEAAESNAGERRHLTVLFCDLVSSTEIASRLDPEHWHEIALEYQQVTAAAARRMGGYVAKYLGDGLVVCFGYPEAQENAAERAVRAGLAMVEAMTPLQQTFAEQYGVALSARVGIHTGSVVIARGGGEEPDIFGDAPNIAARVQSIATPDTVMMTKAVHDLVAGVFVVEDCGAHALKGVDQPLQLYRAVSAGVATGHARGYAAPAKTPFVGREHELSLLASRWAAVRDGEGQFVLITGEPGIGKTRLTEEFRSRLGGEPHLWIETGGAPLLANTTFHAVIQVLHQGLGWRGDETPQERFTRLEQSLGLRDLALDETVPLIAELLDLPVPDTYPPLTLGADERRRRLIDALVGWLFAAARSQPAVMVMEDLHWVDPSTLELIEALANRGATAPLLLICTARPEFRAPWPARSHHAQLMLNRLNSRDTRELVSGVFSRAGLAQEVIDAVTARADGVPLFAEELSRLMVDRDGSLGAHDIPATLQDSLSARLDRLGEAKEAAQLGAVIGREFSFDLLRLVSGWPEAKLQAALARLADAELIYVRGAPPAASYRFKHALILDAAYGALLMSKRRELHGRVARTLVQSFPDIAEAQPELLARHWSEAGEVDLAVQSWSEAARRAAARAAHVEAVGYLRTALSLLRRKPADEVRARAEFPLLTRLAVSLSATLGYSVPEVGEALAEARAICEAQNDLPGLFSVLINICNFEATAGDLDAAEAAARRCEAISDQTGLASHRIQAQYMIAYALYSKGELEEARRYLESSGRLYKESDGGTLTFFTPTDALVESLSTLCIVLYALGEFEQAAERADELLAHARSLARPYDLVYALGFRCVYDTFAGRFDDLLRHASEGLTVCEENGFSTYRAVAATFQGIAIGQVRSVPEGLKVFHPAVADLRRLGVLRALGLYIGEAAQLHLNAGDAATALASVDEALELSHRSYRICLPRLHRLKAEILAQIPGVRRAAVTAELKKALAVAEIQGARAFADVATQRLEAGPRAAVEDAAV
jgi:predicted ATPase/class 3 adenylate cyclase